MFIHVSNILWKPKYDVSWKRKINETTTKQIRNDFSSKILPFYEVNFHFCSLHSTRHRTTLFFKGSQPKFRKSAVLKVGAVTL